MTTLVVSPHLDDAILSLGGAIARWARGGERVVIGTIYTTGPSLAEVPASMHKFADYVTRRAEEEAACKAVGAEHRLMGRVERAFRRPFLSGMQFFTTPATRDDFTALRDVTAAIDALLEIRPSRIVLPLGIGNHIDHVETMLAATDRVLDLNITTQVSFYEDFYALGARSRSQHFVGRRVRWRPWQAPLLRARRLGVILNAIATARRGPPLEDLLAAPWRTAEWKLEPVALDDFEQVKLDAIACYASQTAAFGGFGGIARALRTYHGIFGGEPLWRATF